jgi:hypothetical protein
MSRPLVEAVRKRYLTRSNAIVKVDASTDEGLVYLWVLNRFAAIRGEEQIRVFEVSDIPSLDNLAAWMRGVGNIQDMLPDTGVNTRCLLKDGVTSEEFDEIFSEPEIDY